MDFLNRIFDIKSRPSEEKDFETFEYDAIKHMRANWDHMYLLNNKMNLLHVSDKEFIYFLEQIVHPIIRLKEEQEKYVDMINSYLEKDGYKLINDDLFSFYGFNLKSSMKG